MSKKTGIWLLESGLVYDGPDETQYFVGRPSQDQIQDCIEVSSCGRGIREHVVSVLISNGEYNSHGFYAVLAEIAAVKGEG